MTDRVEPEWLTCERCLWFIHETEDCGHYPKAVYIILDYFCSHWTCARCWGPRDEWLSESISAALTDHDLCEPVTFGKEKTP